jgi:hypothetical protein
LKRECVDHNILGLALNIPCLLLVTGFLSAGEVVEGTVDVGFIWDGFEEGGVGFGRMVGGGAMSTGLG